MQSIFSASLHAAVILSLIGAGTVLAHEGHDHGDAPPPVTANVAPRAEATSEAYELVAIARGGEITIYLDRFATNEPVDGATIEVETPLGSEKAGDVGDVYRLRAPWVAKPGRYDLIVTVTKNGTADVLPITVEIPSGSLSDKTPVTSWVSTSAFASDLKDRFRRNDPAVITAAIAGGLLTAVFAIALLRRRKGRIAAALLIALGTLAGRAADAHEGEDHAPTQPTLSATTEFAQRLPDGTIFVPKPSQRIFGIRTSLTETGTYRRSIELPGRIIPDPNASGYVQAAVGGRLSAPPGGFPRLGTPVKQGDVLAYVSPALLAIDVSTMRQQQGDLDQQISIVERRLARQEFLGPNVIPRSQLEDTRLELQGLKERRASLDKVRREPEALVAPVAGVVADGTPVAGQIAQPNAIIFQIIDPARLWIEALSFDAVAGPEEASAVTSSGQRLFLSYRGSGLADRSQSIPVHFAIEGDASGLRAGQFVTVLVETSEKKQGIAIPRTGIMRGASGQDLVYEHITAERFAPRAIRVEPLDSERVLIPAGISTGKRVVVQGAELLDHVR